MKIGWTPCGPGFDSQRLHSKDTVIAVSFFLPVPCRCPGNVGGVCRGNQAPGERTGLDRALFRRFDDVLEYSLPDDELAEQMLRSPLALLDTTRVDWAQIVSAARGSSYAEIVRVCEDAAKDSVLNDRTEVTTQDILDALAARLLSRA